MRVALISDIHGNSVSLEAVLADIERENVDQIICLGDISTLGPKPVEVMDRIRDLGCECILGNHDFFLLILNISINKRSINWEGNCNKCEKMIF